MLGSFLFLALALALANIIRLTNAAGGTPIPVTLYTDIDCNVPSTQNSNVTINTGTCAVTPGLGSVVLDPFPCTSGDVQVAVFSDTACGKQDDIFVGINHCFERAVEGSYAAMMLFCSAEENGDPGPPTATTTIQVAPIATGAPSPTAATGAAAAAATSGATTPSPSGTGSSSSPPSSSGSSGGWDSLGTGAKVGIIIGAIAAVAAGGLALKCVISPTCHCCTSTRGHNMTGGHGSNFFANNNRTHNDSEFPKAWQSSPYELDSRNNSPRDGY